MKVVLSSSLGGQGGKCSLPLEDLPTTIGIELRVLSVAHVDFDLLLSPRLELEIGLQRRRRRQGGEKWKCVPISERRRKVFQEKKKFRRIIRGKFIRASNWSALMQNITWDALHQSPGWLT